MATRASHNKNNSAIKRIMQEARELATDPSTDYAAAPLEEDIFEWHCTMRGSPGTEFEGGLYHFRILLPAEYPFRPPAIMMLTPNGRFELNTKICISFTNYHEELWQPAWGVRTAIIGLQGFFPLKGQAAVGVGSLDTPVSERRRLAKLSRGWVCPHCKVANLECLPDPPAVETGAPELMNTSTGSRVEPPPVEVSSDKGNNAGPVQGQRHAPQHVSTASDQISGDSSQSAQPSPQTLLDDRMTQRTSTTAGAGHDVHEGVVAQGNVEGPNAAASGSTGVPVQVTSSADLRAASTSSSSTATSPRPPIMLDAAIGVLLVLVAALLLRRLA